MRIAIAVFGAIMMAVFGPAACLEPVAEPFHDDGVDSGAPDGGRPDGAATSDGSAGSDPGFIECGGAACRVRDNYCCVMRRDGGARCVPLSYSACAGLRRTCDEVADCDGGAVCCIPPNAAMALAYNAECMANCNDSTSKFLIQVCKSSAECQNGQPCVTQTCQGESIRSCGAIPTNRCQ